MAEAHSGAVALMRSASPACHSLGHGVSANEQAARSPGFRPTLGVVPGQRLRRQATLAKGFRLMQPPAALPLFDMSVAVIDSLNIMRASIEDEVVIQSTLGVPAHHALACRIEAYGTPVGAPGLHEVASGAELSEDDKEFAACLAAPPDFEAAESSLSLQRMASLSVLQRAAAPAPASGEARAPPPAAAERARGGAGPEMLRSPSVQSERKKQKASGLHGGMRQDSVGARAASVLELDEGEGESCAGEGGAGPASARGPAPGLLAGAGDAVSALVGAGYLLLRAAGFDRRAPRALERLSSGLRRMSSIRSDRSGPALQQGALGAAGFCG